MLANKPPEIAKVEDWVFKNARLHRPNTNDSPNEHRIINNKIEQGEKIVMSETSEMQNEIPRWTVS